ncbi:Notchless-like protein isoform 1 [Zea mays]|uniref:Notchless-like protein isoform 1 n=1 Tax=Zea mays TaxID=4577 RepID=A0A1D6MEH3_MAIZE|nr:Notchless-like protein isoform 1 [Zea mays]AQK89045.1 Notchless-like protein isoform 1 [Zea mays]AQK89046.1 Notchless-like protein isoform 1 [Zea mays]AQK89049.1 Notchless-like protein isoform 1 [Zea mays]
MDIDASASVMCQLLSPEGDPLGSALYLPQNVGPPQLQEIVNQLLHNEEKLPYAFYVGDEELSVHLGAYMRQKNANVEVTLRIVCQPQALFRIRPVNRCSATIAGHTEAVIAVSFSPDGKSLASGSGDTTVRFWDLSTQTPLFTCKGECSVPYPCLPVILLQCCSFLKFWSLSRLHIPILANLILVARQTTKMNDVPKTPVYQ